MSHRSPLLAIAENLAKAHWDTVVLEPKTPDLAVSAAQWQSAQEAINKIDSSSRKILLIYGPVDAKFQKDSESPAKSMDALVFLSVQTNEENSPTLLKWLEDVKKPVFDITAFFDYKTVLSSASARSKKFIGDPQYRTTQIEGANHDYAEQSVIVAKAIQGWVQNIK